MADAVRVCDPAAITGYVEGLFAPEDDVLRRVRQRMRQAELPEISVSAEVGRLLQVLLHAVAARRVLEIGTLGGYSAIWMARALPDPGSLLTLEIDADRARLARTNIVDAGLASRVEVVHGDAHEALSRLDRAQPFDACFIDAEKTGYTDYLEQALELVRPGGLIIADNVLWGGRVLEPAEDEPDTAALIAFGRRLAAEPALATTILPIRDGLAVAVVRRAERLL
ncbi:MAG: O-methyltransferase [Longimicrobiales bacterium]